MQSHSKEENEALYFTEEQTIYLPIDRAFGFMDNERKLYVLEKVSSSGDPLEDCTY